MPCPVPLSSGSARGMRSRELIRQIQAPMSALLIEPGRNCAISRPGSRRRPGITISAGARAVTSTFSRLLSLSRSPLTARTRESIRERESSTMAALFVAGVTALPVRRSGSMRGRDRGGSGVHPRGCNPRSSHRGKSQVGDKTILDAMVPAVDLLADSPVQPRGSLRQRRPRAAPSTARSSSSAAPSAT